jgi:hypothetical protein
MHTLAIDSLYCTVANELGRSTANFYRMFSGFELMVDSDIILIKVENAERDMPIRFLVVNNSAFCVVSDESFVTAEKRSQSRVLSAQLLLVILRHIDRRSYTCYLNVRSR